MTISANFRFKEKALRYNKRCTARGIACPPGGTPWSGGGVNPLPQPGGGLGCCQQPTGNKYSWKPSYSLFPLLDLISERCGYV